MEKITYGSGSFVQDRTIDIYWFCLGLFKFFHGMLCIWRLVDINENIL
jgi:hypothetical protein